MQKKLLLYLLLSRHTIYRYNEMGKYRTCPLILCYMHKNKALKMGKTDIILNKKNILLTFFVHIAIITNENSWNFDGR